MTAAPFLATKVHIPSPRPNLVPRPQLLQVLDDGLRLGHRLTLISAPAGTGKTTLLSDWLAHLRSSAADLPWPLPPWQDCQQRPYDVQIHVAWLTLNGDDDDPRRFWAYLVAALQTVEAGLGRRTLDLLKSPQLPAADAILTPMLNEIEALRASSAHWALVMVLDDYHVISDPAIHRGLAFLLDHQPTNLHLAIATRADPPLPLFRLRARGQLTDLRRADLRFSADEALTFLNRVMGLALTREQAMLLEGRTEGWIAGLQLAALSLQGREDTDAFIAAFSGSHHYVLEYLTEEVLRRQPPQVRRFLVQTSMLERLCGPLCEAVLGDSTAAVEDMGGRGGEEDPSIRDRSPSFSQEMLALLHRQNLFVVPLDDERRWYRYHHLFADLLANLLRQEQPPERIQELHLRASEWYEANGLPEEAVGHALRADAFERASSLIEGAAPAALAQGQLATLLRWLEALPEVVVRPRPQLILYLAWALHLSGRSVQAERILLGAQSTLRAQAPTPESEVLQGKVAALLAGIAALRGGASETIGQAEEALCLLPADDRISRARVHVALGTALAYGDRAEEAEKAWRQAAELALEAGNPFLATAAIELLAGTQIYHLGRLQQGVRELQQVLDLGATPDGPRLPFAATAHALLADVFLEWNDLEAASSYLAWAIELQQQGGIAHGLTHTYCARARLARAQGRAQDALEALQKAREATAAVPMWHIILHHAACQTRLRLWLGDIGGAARWARADRAAVEQDLPEALPSYLREVRQLSLARVHLARGALDDALEAVGAVRAEAEAAGRMAHVIEACLLQALGLQAKGDLDAGLDSLERSLLFAEPEGYVRLFLEAGEPLRILLARLRARAESRSGIGPSERRERLLAHADSLLAAFAGGARQATPAPKTEQRSRAQGLVEPLTPRELEVLRLVCEGLSNAEIAERLTVTLNTVKKHTSNIYGKLQVRSRSQAIVQARELGLY